MSGTNLFAPEVNKMVVQTALVDENGYAILVKCPTASIPSAVAGYAVGCLLINTTSGVLYTNTGSVTSCTFSATV